MLMTKGSTYCYRSKYGKRPEHVRAAREKAKNSKRRRVREETNALRDLYNNNEIDLDAMDVADQTPDELVGVFDTM